MDPDPDPDPTPDPTPNPTNFCYAFFYIKNYNAPINDLFRYFLAYNLGALN